jgi:hypothetical protein
MDDDPPNAITESGKPGQEAVKSGGKPIEAFPVAGVAMKHNDLEAMKLLKEWSTWLVAIQTAAIGAIAAGLKDVAFNTACTISHVGITCDGLARSLATCVIVCFGVSIVAALYLLLALPAIAQRLPPIGGDIYTMRTVRGAKLPVYWYVRLERWGSVSGFLCFAVLIILVVWTDKPR